MKVICFQPHDDDCVIAIGGIVQKMLKHAWELSYVYVTDGRHGSQTIPPEELVEIRRVEAQEERALLGIHHFVELGVTDGSVGKLRGMRLESLKQQLISILVSSRPDLILVPTRSDMHSDHSATHDLVVNAVEKIQLSVPIAKYFVWLFPDFYQKLPDIADQILMVGVDNEMATKVAAVRVHRSQIAGCAYDSMTEMINAYFAYAFNAPDRIGSRYVEIIGLFKPHYHRHTTSELLRVLMPSADITTVLHGRPSERIRQ